MYTRICLSLIALGLAVSPAFAQSRFEVEAREKAMQRARDAAIRAAENPEPTNRTAQAAPEPQAAPAAEALPAAEPVAPAQGVPPPAQ